MKKTNLRNIIRELIKKDLLEINPLNEVQCPCFADKHMSAGSEPLMCTNSTGNVVSVTGCCGSGAGSADAPVHALCNGKTCDNLDYNSPGCWDNIHREKDEKTQIAHTNANPQQTGFPRPTGKPAKYDKNMVGEIETGGLPTDTDGCQCCRDAYASGDHGWPEEKGDREAACCRYCKRGSAMAAAPTKDMSEYYKGGKKDECPCCKTGYEQPCCKNCYLYGPPDKWPTDDMISKPSIDKMMREATKNMMLEYTYTQAEGDAVCAGAGHGPMTGYNCVDDGSGVTETCTISCEGGMVTVGGDNNPPLALDKTRTKQQDDGEVTTFTITSIGENGEKGKTIKANRNHKVIRNLDLTNATKIKQLTKGQDPSKEDRLNEGILCCWLRGGCCGWEQNFPFPHSTGWNPDDKTYEHWAGYVIEWNACCGNSGKGGCC